MSETEDYLFSIFPFAFEFIPSTFFIQWAFIIVLVLLSGMFSGLNLGLMSLDKLGLEVFSFYFYKSCFFEENDLHSFF